MELVNVNIISRFPAATYEVDYRQTIRRRWKALGPSLPPLPWTARAARGCQAVPSAEVQWNICESQKKSVE